MLIEGLSSGIDSTVDWRKLPCRSFTCNCKEVLFSSFPTNTQCIEPNISWHILKDIFCHSVRAVLIYPVTHHVLFIVLHPTHISHRLQMTYVMFGRSTMVWITICTRRVLVGFARGPMGVSSSCQYVKGIVWVARLYCWQRKKNNHLPTFHGEKRPNQQRALLINSRLSSGAEFFVNKHRLSMQIGGQMCMQFVCIPTELPFCITPLLVGDTCAA